MDIDLSALKVLFKKIFPPKDCIFTVDTDNDGLPDAVLIRAINVVMAIEVPSEIELGGFSTEDFDVMKFDLADYGKIYLDAEPITIAREVYDLKALKERFLFYHKGERFNIDDIINGKLAGRIIALGDSISILIKIDSEALKKFQVGKHKFRLESELIPAIEFNFEITEKNLNIKFDPTSL
jgi:hypothetical protein